MNKNSKFKIKNFKGISFSAPAKIHVIGEHAAVYGKPAIISAINLRLYLKITQNSNAGKSKNTPNLSKLQKAIETSILKTYKLKRIPSYEAEINSEFQPGTGLGASAAISATLTASLLKMLKIKADKKQIYEIALAGEKAVHKNPSGSDLAAAIFGGTLWFRRELPTLSLTSPLPSVASAKKGIPLILPNLYLIDSGKPVESTGVIVAKVAKLNATTKKETFDRLELLAKDLASGGDLKQIFKEANDCLVELGVVSKSTQKFITLIEKSGGAAKITGAGGWKNGSGMIIVFHPQPEKLNPLNLDFIKIKPARKGLRLEN